MPTDLDFDPALADRIVRLCGAHNFRRIAGWRTADGKRVAPGRLYRASSLHALEEEDLVTIASMSIGHIVDLRTASERELLPPRWPTPVPQVWTGAESSANADLTRMMARDSVSLADFRDGMRKVYADFPEDLGDAVADLLATLLEIGDGEAVLVHCAAGKDRTGFVVAMVLRALGVREEDILDDYLLTNATFERAFAAFAAGHKLDRLEAAVPGASHAMLGAHADYLASADQSLIAHWGSMDAYLAEVGRLTPAARAHLRARFLVPES